MILDVPYGAVLPPSHMVFSNLNFFQIKNDFLGAFSSSDDDYDSNDDDDDDGDDDDDDKDKGDHVDHENDEDNEDDEQGDYR